MGESDEEAVVRSIAVDPDAFIDLFKQHGPPVHAYLARRAGKQDADDLLSEVWLRAFKGRASLRSPDPLPWLYGIARNVLHSHWHQRGRRTVPATERGVFDPWADTDTRLDALSQRGQLRQTLETLSSDEREVLLLVVWERLAPGQVALVLGIPQGTARSRLHRALSKLRDEGGASSPALVCAQPEEA